MGGGGGGLGGRVLHMGNSCLGMNVSMAESII